MGLINSGGGSGSKGCCIFRSSLYLLQDRGQNGGSVTVLGRVLAVEAAQLLKARQLQGVQVRGVVLGQMPVSLQLNEGEKAKTSESHCKDISYFPEKTFR